MKCFSCELYAYWRKCCNVVLVKNGNGTNIEYIAWKQIAQQNGIPGFVSIASTTQKKPIRRSCCDTITEKQKQHNNYRISAARAHVRHSLINNNNNNIAPPRSRSRWQLTTWMPDQRRGYALTIYNNNNSNQHDGSLAVGQMTWRPLSRFNAALARS